MAQNESYASHGVDNASLILDTIDQLRKRKARPDKERICHMLQRRNGIAIETTAAQLEKLVDAEVVVKVDYKGNTSYRNAAKWRKSHMGHVLNSNEVQGLIRQAVVSLTGYQEVIKKEENGGALPSTTHTLSTHAPTTHAPTATTTATTISAPADSTQQHDSNNGGVVAETTTTSAQQQQQQNPEDDDPDLAEKKLFINITPIDNPEQSTIVKIEGQQQQQQQHQHPIQLSQQPQQQQHGSLLAIKREKGTTFTDIEGWLRARDPGTSLSGKALFMALKREVDAGRLAKQPHDGTYIIGSGIPLPKKSPAKSNKLTVKDLLSPGEGGADGGGGGAITPGSGGADDSKKWVTTSSAAALDKDWSPKEKVKKPPKKVCCQLLCLYLILIQNLNKLFLQQQHERFFNEPLLTWKKLNGCSH